MTKTTYGYMCGMGYTDFDGTFATAEWIEPYVEGKPPSEKTADPDSLGWYAMCEVCDEHDFGWCGPFPTEAEAIKCATDENTFWEWVHGDDPMGDYMGRNV